MDDLDSEDSSQNLALDLIQSQFVDIITDFKDLNDEPTFPNEYDIFRTLTKVGNIKSGFPYKLGTYYLCENDLFMRLFEIYKQKYAYSLKEFISKIMNSLRHKFDKEQFIGFEGWTKYSIEIKKYSTVFVKPPSVGNDQPSEVRAELEYSQENWEENRKEEWDNLKEGEFLLLIGLKKPFTSEENVTKEHLFVRGCILSRQYDEDYNELSSKKQIISKGTKRVMNLLLDCNQFKNDLESKEITLYDHFSVLLRRETSEKIYDILNALKISAMQNSISQMKPNCIPFQTCHCHKEELVNNQIPSRLKLHKIFNSQEHYEKAFFNNELIDKEVKDKMDILIDKSLTYAMTKEQVAAFINCHKEGLSILTGGPGTGKTFLIANLIGSLLLNNPNERVILLANSNSQLNSLLVQVLMRVNEEKVVQLGYSSPKNSYTDLSKLRKVNSLLTKRIVNLNEVKKIANSINIKNFEEYQCESAKKFYEFELVPRWNEFIENINQETNFEATFPFRAYFTSLFNNDKIFSGDNKSDLEKSKMLWNSIVLLFKEIEEALPMEILRNEKERKNYIVTNYARVIAMTLKYASKKYSKLKNIIGNTLIIDNAGQSLEGEMYLLMSMPKNLRMIILVGDLNEYSPEFYQNNENSFEDIEESISLMKKLFLGNFNSHILNTNFDTKKSIVEIWSNFYPNIITNTNFENGELLNRGFEFNCQLIDVRNGSESSPMQGMFVNLEEAEFSVALYLFMRLHDYQTKDITILTSTKSQKNLIKEILNQKCGIIPSITDLSEVKTIFKYQGLKNKYIILSLVRTKENNTFENIESLINCFSRATEGLYVLCNLELFRKRPTLYEYLSKLERKENELYLNFENKILNCPDSTNLYKLVQIMVKERFR